MWLASEPTSFFLSQMLPERLLLIHFTISMASKTHCVLIVRNFNYQLSNIVKASQMSGCVAFCKRTSHIICSCWTFPELPRGRGLRGRECVTRVISTGWQSTRYSLAKAHTEFPGLWTCLKWTASCCVNHKRKNFGIISRPFSSEVVRGSCVENFVIFFFPPQIQAVDPKMC